LPDVRGLTPTGHLQLPARSARLRSRLGPKANACVWAQKRIEKFLAQASLWRYRNYYL
jgi:hypothetical protein